MRKKDRDLLARNILTEMYDYLHEKAVPGKTLKSLESGARKIIDRHEIESSTIDYLNFGSAISWGVNEKMAHMPSTGYRLKAGDLVSADIAIKVGGFHYDSCRSFIVRGGKNSDRARKTKLLTVAKKARDLGILLARPGMSLRAIRVAVNKFVTDSGYYVIPSVGGHGIYNKLHHEPLILFGNIEGQYDKYRLKTGDRVTIEPIISERKGLHRICKYDGWTLSLDEDNLSAYWEETIEITTSANKIVTNTYDQFTRKGDTYE
jgi:methionyl aminopeptidase